MNIEFEILDKNHNKSNFECGNIELDIYLQNYAMQDVKRNLTKVFVALDINNIIAYYTLSPLSIQKDNLPALFFQKLPRYPIPTILLGRLAVSSKYQGQGYGSMALINALKRVYNASLTTFGIYAVVVKAKDEKAKLFYQHFGFLELPDKSMHLVLPMSVIAKLFL